MCIAKSIGKPVKMPYQGKYLCIITSYNGIAEIREKSSATIIAKAGMESLSKCGINFCTMRGKRHGNSSWLYFSKCLKKMISSKSGSLKNDW